MANCSMGHQLPPEEKKNRTSFWGKLFRTSKKSISKECKSDDSFRRQSSLYHSFHCSSIPQESNASQDEDRNFTTLESSAFMDMHKDAGIIFLNKNSIASSMITREEDRRVQFVPTPMNKYYRVDVKSAPSKSVKNDENKENSVHCTTLKPTRPILRLGRSRDNLSHKELPLGNRNTTETNMNRLSVTYVDGPQVKKTPTIQRTSTKVTLIDRKNGSLPYLNVSGITKYGSLPRTAKINEERHYSENTLQVSSNPNNVKEMLFFPPNETRQLGSTCNLTEAEFQKRFLQSNLRKIDKPGCFSIPDIPRHIEQKQYHRQVRVGTKQNITHRYSMGEPLMQAPGIETRSLDGRRYGSIKEYSQLRTVSESNVEKPFASSTGQRACALKETSNAAITKIQDIKRGNCQLPNKAINEVGLPTALHKDQRQILVKTRSESPHYIPLSETYSSNRLPKQNKFEKGHIRPISCPVGNADFIRPDIPRQSRDFQKSVLKDKSNAPPNLSQTVEANSIKITQTNPVLKPMENKINRTEYSHFVSQARMQSIRSSMHSHRRKFVNKLCKYKSKECEDGFSSMADDECSFNCSCSSCLSKFSREYRKNRNALPLSKDDKLFFITTEDHRLTERSNLAPVPEMPMAENNSKCTVDETESVTDQILSNTRYDCNDSLCKTPANIDNKLCEEKPTIPRTTEDCQEDKIVESIYENLTQIINSATKKNFKTQDVERMFSTPLSRIKVRKQIADSTSSNKVSRALFSSVDNLHGSAAGSVQRAEHIPSSAKSPIVFSDSVILLQEIFQKLSEECRELLQPNVSSATPLNKPNSNSSMNSNNSESKYVNDLVKNLRSKEISEGDFANIIGGIAQNIFLEAKLKQKVQRLSHSTSLPDLTKEDLSTEIEIKPASSQEDIPSLPEQQFKIDYASNTNTASDSGFKTDGDMRDESSNAMTDKMVENESLGDRHLPDGWSRTPTTESNTSTEKSNSSKEDSRSTESEMQIVENAIRLGMGLSPINKLDKSTFYSMSPAKATKYKSRDVLSGKGKLKLKIYHNSGLVTVHVMRAAKLNRLSGKDLNPYIKISMVPDCSKRVHWRTSVQKGQKNAVFNQKFSFEVLTEDAMKRLVFSVWHRDFAKERSELVGCMSFSVRHVMDDSHFKGSAGAAGFKKAIFYRVIDGWYRLLREGFGTQKHFAAHTRRSSCSLKHVK